METVIGVFDAAYVDRALQALYDHGFEKNRVRLVDRERSVEGPDVGVPGVVTPNPLGTNPVAPVIAYDPVAFGADLSVLGRGDAIEFYRHSIEDGATVILVNARDEKEAEAARQIMRKAHASNVTEPLKDQHSRV